MARVRSVDFLPEIFQTPVERQFLSATLDQLVQEPAFTKTQGYVGRKVGPGVNPQDRYVIEPTKARNDYQLEPGVISVNAETQQIQDAITYPGILDALALQGADVDNADRLFKSDYYTWDPFVDFDKFVNYQQYYWLPGGPLDVDVSSVTVPTQDTYTVTRTSTGYTFVGENSSYPGNNPTVTLVRGGSYQFNLAQNAKQTVNYTVTNQLNQSYVINNQNNPTLTLVRGNTYTFTLVLSGVLPFFIKTEASLGPVNAYDSGVINNGATVGTVTFTVPQDAPDTLFYSCSTEFNLRGQLNIIDGTAGTGPNFWIQSEPGVSGVLPYAPNISSRGVLGVENNGIDLGTLTFDVPEITAQNFFYDLQSIANVDLVTTLTYEQINGQPVAQFLVEQRGIDGITDIEGRTLIFQRQDTGWGSVPPDQRYNIWRITYDSGNIVLVNLFVVNPLQKFNILYGTQFSSTSWYKNTEGFFEEIPQLTATKEVLFYQDSESAEFVGQFRLVDNVNPPLLIADILGRRSYTSPNGVVFTNGLKVTFRGDVVPNSYTNNSYYVEGVGTGIRLLPVTDFVTPESTNSASIPYDTLPYDVGNYDGTLDAPLDPDYLTINRASPDLNAWSRSNRWFHIDVINASAAYNNTVPIIDNSLRGRRPILEFRSGLRLYDFGTQGKQPVNVIDFSETDAFTNINGTTGYSFNGYSFVQGTRVIFAADIDSTVRNRIYTVNFITPDTVPPLIAQPIINLVPAIDSQPLFDQTVVCLSGEQKGLSFWFDGVTWQRAQDKTEINQAPLFDVFDANGISLGNRATYPSSTFTGSKLFSYASGTGANDPVLGFALRYLSLTNIGDIVFDNNLYTDNFVYVDQSVSITAPVSQGFVRQYKDRTAFSRLIGWQPAVTRSIDRQQFQFTYDGSPLKLDIAVDVNNVIPAVQLFVNAAFQDPSTYTINVTEDSTTITLNNIYVPGDVIEVAVISDQISDTAFYQIPINLENNPFNANSPQFTLGTVRSHYETIGQNLLNIQGPINGANNTRDLGNIVPYGLQILQQSSPLTLPGFFMRRQEFDIFAAIEYNSREYTKFKNLMLDTVVRNEWPTDSVSDILDGAITLITKGRTDINPFYWSDMCPSGPVYTENKYTISAITVPVFDTVQTYSFTQANFQGLSVYLTRTVARETTTTLLLRGTEYTVSTDGPRLTVTAPLQIGDVISIREYANTAGNYVPNTPSKMGLYPKYQPRVFVDNSYINPTVVIQGHDGSITVAFGDIRDQVLLEFEKRIYNNIKVDGNPVPLSAADIIPGFFRTTAYSQEQITTILSESFLTWVGWNKLDYKTQDYQANNPFTYNYSASGARLTPNDTVSNISTTPLPGAWRGIYRLFYDTLSPNTTPWEMLGLSEKPTWWEERYGPAPYTQDNLVLWDDLEAGLVADPFAPYVVPQYRRPGLTSVIPSGTEGQLLDPLQSVVGPYDPNSFRKSWAVGDGGPVEAAWWTSSNYPFAVMRLLALTRPAEFFNLFVDRDLYRYDAELDQYLYKGRYRYDASATNPNSPNSIQLYGRVNSTDPGVSKASYINWIIDYNQQLGRNSTATLTTDLTYLDVRLCYRMASFTNKQYLKIFTEKSSPNSTNSGLLLPDDSYSLLVYKNQPFADIVYSSVIVERVATGYAVYGYSTSDPYFTIFASATGGALQTISAGGATVRVPTQYTDTEVQIPYGFVFSNTTMVVDFLLSYGAKLQASGLGFVGMANGYELTWQQMAREFLYFSQQDWSPGTLINLNPSANDLRAFRAGAVVDTIDSLTPENMVLDQNRTPLETRDMIVTRDGNSFRLQCNLDKTISYIRLRYTNYEHMVVLDNISIFADLIYDPITAARQNRVRVSGSTTTDWNGVVDAQGFILNENNVREWQANRKYTKGEIVLFKNTYWSAQTIVQPKLLFDYNDWVKADYTAIQEGLLPNIANKADQLANSYNTYSANLERDNDLLSYGLIGFRPREYMTALDLDDVSQVNIYQQFLGSKGTTRAAEIFTRADLGKESGAYKIFENWAILAGTYGANANRSFFELRLNEALLQSNPSTIQVIEPQQISRADQTVTLDGIWRESFVITSPDILPTYVPEITDTALPSAGYVNLDDVDLTVYSLDDPAVIAENIESIGTGTTIWVARINAYDWNIYRCEQVPGRITQVTDNLNNTSVVSFSTAHGLKRGDLVVIRFFNDSVDGVYRVLSVPGIQQITISYSFENTNQTQITGIGLAFFLQTTRVAQASDVANLPYAQSLIAGAKVWVDDDGTGHWQVLEKTNPFTEFTRLTTPSAIANSRFGTSLAQSADRFTALAGAPNTNSGAGSVFTYRRDVNDRYAFNIELAFTATDTVGFGSSLTFGNTTWGVSGAPDSLAGVGYALVLYQVPGTNNFIYSQVLVPPDQDFSPNGFGSAVAISQDERWLYVGAPGANQVYAYGRVDVEDQSVSYVTDGTQFSFNYSNHIQIDPTQTSQLVVNLENLQQGTNVNFVYAIDYVINDTDVVLLVTPAAGLKLTIRRRMAAQLDNNTYYGVLQSTTSGSGTGAIFTINVQRGVYYPTVVSPGINYAPGDTVTIDGATIGGATPANNLTITVNTVDDVGAIATFTPSGSGIGNTAVFQLNPFLYTATNINSFTVTVDGVIQRPYIDYVFGTDSSLSSQDITFLTVPPVGAVISVFCNSYFEWIDTLTVSGLAVDANFGSAITTTTDGRQVLIGADLDDAVNQDLVTVTNAGTVTAFDRSVYRILVTDTTQLVYPIPGAFVEPVAVSLNGQFLTNTNQFVNGGFSVSGTDIVLQPTVSLTVGDILEIETNQFTQLQTLVADDPRDEAAFGQALAVCSTNCSVYIGEPKATVTRPQEGQVQRSVNQSRLYGVITSTVANPALTAGNNIRINDQLVAVPGGAGQNVAGLAAAIRASGIPNVTATTTPDLEFVGDGVTTIYDIGTLYSAAASYTTLVLVDGTALTPGVDYSYNATTQQIIFATAPAFRAAIRIVSGRLTISVVNAEASKPGNLLTVLPGNTGTAFATLGFETYVSVQTLQSPNATDFAHFGQTLDIDSSAVNLVIGAPNGDIYRPVIFDGGATFFDDRSTTFFTPVFNSGVAYTFDFLPSANSSVTNPGKFVFGQQLFDTETKTQDEFAASISYRGGRLLIGSPGNDLNINNQNFGVISVFSNPNNLPSWAPIHQQQPVVNIYQLNSVFMYDRLSSTVQQYFDFFDPLQGKILGAARRNIDYIGAVDPAQYNVGPVGNAGNSWAAEHVGEIWWDTDTVRFIDPNQDDITYASRRWGQTFPGSRVDIYQWISSAVPPVSYTGPGIPLSTVSFTVSSQLNQFNIFETRYYFWVRGLDTIDTGANKTLSTVGIARYIENPRASGIPYVAPINASTLAIYNGLDFISAADTILHVEYDRQLTDANIHQEYDLIADGRADGFLNDRLYQKLLDSFCGVTEGGANVPDPLLSPPERYGVQFRPRQSMFVNRFAALENYLTRANTIFRQFPLLETRILSLFYSSEPIPNGPIPIGNQWNQELANIEELSYQNLNAVPLGWRYLITVDSTQNGLWTIYEVQAGRLPGERVTGLVRVQNFDTPRYWTPTDWYQPGYNPTINPVAEVVNYADLATLSLTQAPVGSSVKVTANAQGKFEIYLRTDTGWTRVGLEDGTLQINEEIWNYAVGNFGFDVEVFDAQYFDQEPVIETRKILQGINQEIFTDELEIERNRSLMLMFDFIYSEFEAPDWLFKTSLIDVDHNIRALRPFQNYLRDNQDFVLQYINEVKPYHVYIREFNLTYFGEDTFLGDLTDYDVPAYYDRTLAVPQYVSPILTPYTLSDSFVQSTASDAASNAEIWSQWPWNQWFNNYTLAVDAVNMISGGSGYTSLPTVTVTGGGGTGADLIPTINSAGQLVAITVANPGTGYTTTPTITIAGGGGTGARAVAVMGNDLVRNIRTTIKYDRCEYRSDILPWVANKPYENGELVRYLNRVWRAANQDSSIFSSPIFNFDEWTAVDASDLGGADRTMGFYTPTANQPGLSLPLLIDGVDYPGVQVTGPLFNQDTGFDVGNYDINPFDNIAFGPEGRPTYDPGILDAVYESQYLDVYLGIAPAPAYGGAPPNLPTAVVVAGGEYVDTYSSHAPEELVPGIEFDTMDFRVYTTPGSDWTGDGHGFPTNSIRYSYDPSNRTLSFAGLLQYPFTVTVTNLNTGLIIQPESIDWVNYTVTLDNLQTAGDVISLYVSGVGGGNQIFLDSYVGNTIVDRTIVIPFPFNEVYETLIYAGDQQLTPGIDYTVQALGDRTSITFPISYTAQDRLNLAVFGFEPPGVPNHSWSLPVTQLTTLDSSLAVTISASLQGTNPANLIVYNNGRRLRGSQGADYIGDGVTTTFDLPNTGGYSQGIIANNDVSVYVDNVLIPQTISYTVTAPAGPAQRSVVFNSAPALGAKILISVRTGADYWILGDQISWQAYTPVAGDEIGVITWNDTSQQGLITQAFVGDSVSNTFDLGYVVTDTERILVSRNGLWLVNGQGFTIEGSNIILRAPIMTPSDVLIVTSFTASVVSGAMAFRIFQDMRGLQATYRITPATTTTLAQPCSATDTVIYVTDVSKLGAPEVDRNIWGVCMIDGERIMYRERNLSTNTISSLLRGTAGTGAAAHAVGAAVTDLGRGNFLPEQFQDYVVKVDHLGDGSTMIYSADTITVPANRITAVEVYVGGIKQCENFIADGTTTEYVLPDNLLINPVVSVNGVVQTSGFTQQDNFIVFDSPPANQDIILFSSYVFLNVAPVAIEFVEPPPAGEEIEILVRRGVTWYAPGPGTASDGVPLQNTNTPAARFLRGL